MEGNIESPLPLIPRAGDPFFCGFIEAGELVKAARQRVQQTEEYLDNPNQGLKHMISSRWTDAHTFAPGLVLHYSETMLNRDLPTDLRAISLAGFAGSILVASMAILDIKGRVQLAKKYIPKIPGYPSMKSLPPDDTEIVPSIDLEVGEYIKAMNPYKDAYPVIEVDTKAAKNKVYVSVSREDTQPSLVHVNIPLLPRLPGCSGSATGTSWGTYIEVGFIGGDGEAQQDYDRDATLVHELTHAADFSSPEAMRESNDYEKTWKRGSRRLLSIASRTNIKSYEEVEFIRYYDDPLEIRARETTKPEIIDRSPLIWVTYEKGHPAQTTKK